MYVCTYVGIYVPIHGILWDVRVLATKLQEYEVLIVITRVVTPGGMKPAS